MRLIIVKVKTNKLTEQQVIVPPWEGLILEEVHGGANIKVVGTDFHDREYPDANEEFDRLERKYRGPADTEETYAGQIFGHGRRGVENLDRLIHEAQVKERRDLAAPSKDLETTQLLSQLSKLSNAKRKLIVQLLTEQDEEPDGELPRSRARDLEDDREAPDLGRFADGVEEVDVYRDELAGAADDDAPPAADEPAPDEAPEPVHRAAARREPPAAPTPVRKRKTETKAPKRGSTSKHRRTA